MIYVIILVIWMTIGMTIDCINTAAIRRVSNKSVGPSILGVVIRYATWGWLIWKIAMTF